MEVFLKKKKLYKSVQRSYVILIRFCGFSLYLHFWVIIFIWIHYFILVLYLFFFFLFSSSPNILFFIFILALPFYISLILLIRDSQSFFLFKVKDMELNFMLAIVVPQRKKGSWWQHTTWTVIKRFSIIKIKSLIKLNRISFKQWPCRLYSINEPPGL